jgi:hypothetical protein
MNERELVMELNVQIRSLRELANRLGDDGQDAYANSVRHYAREIGRFVDMLEDHEKEGAGDPA